MCVSFDFVVSCDEKKKKKIQSNTKTCHWSLYFAINSKTPVNLIVMTGISLKKKKMVMENIPGNS